jgi:hypothetical protein
MIDFKFNKELKRKHMMIEVKYLHTEYALIKQISGCLPLPFASIAASTNLR